MYPSIAGVVSCVPSTRIENSFFETYLERKTIEDISKMTGVQTRYWADSGQTTTDLCISAARHLAEGGEFELKDCDAVIFVSQTPDHILPGSSFIVHRELALSSNCTCLDINSGCSGYVLGLSLANDLIRAGRYTNILLLAGDTISKTITPQDRSTAMIFGDAGTATLIRATNDESCARFIIGTDSSGIDSLKIQNGMFRSRDRVGTEADNLFMDGAAVFNFTLKSIPKLIDNLANLSDQTAQDFDQVLMHQANGFMLRHIAKKAKLDPARVPINIEKFGNTSSATLPLLLCNEVDLTSPKHYALLGFGVGFSWAAASLKIGPVSFVDTLYL